MEFSDFVTHRLEAMRDRSPMYGPPQAVELLAHQLLELEILHYHPDVLEVCPRFASSIFLRKLSKRTGLSTIGLSDPNRQPTIENWQEVLFELCQETRQEITTRIQTGDLIVKW